MTNRIAVWLGLILVAVFALDWAIYHGAFTIFLGRNLLALSEYIAFWR